MHWDPLKYPFSSRRRVIYSKNGMVASSHSFIHIRMDSDSYSWIRIHIRRESFCIPRIPRIFLYNPYTAKNGYARNVFITREAKKELEKWIDYKKHYDLAGVHKDKREEIKKSERIFPFSHSWGTAIFSRVCEDLGFDEKDPQTGMSKLHVHSLRKFFKTKLDATDCPRQTVEALLGHVSNLQGNYRRIPLDDLREDYEKGMAALTIRKIQPKLKKEVEELKEENKELRKELEELKKERRMDQKFEEIARKVFREEFEEGMKLESITEEDEGSSS